MKPWFLLPCLVLAGCAELDAAVGGANTYAAAESAAVVKNVQGFNDNVARATIAALCATPYGELVRNGSGNPNFPSAVVTACGAPPGLTIFKSGPVAPGPVIGAP